MDMIINDQLFSEISQMVYKATGISLKEHKKTLVASRLTKRLNQLKLESVREYLSLVRKSKEEYQIFLNSLTTNKTEFFREDDHFDFLYNRFLKVKQPLYDKWMFWCAACSTGEEAYTISMVFDQCFQQSQVDYRGFATDIDTDVLKKAHEGIYKKNNALKTLPSSYAKMYTNDHDDANFLCIDSKLKEKLKFKQFNLIESQIAVPVKFDVIFLRNVLIYFDEQTTSYVIHRVCENLRPGGLLFLSHSETIEPNKFSLKQVASAVYEKAS